MNNKEKYMPEELYDYDEDTQDDLYDPQEPQQNDIIDREEYTQEDLYDLLEEDYKDKRSTKEQKAAKGKAKKAPKKESKQSFKVDREVQLLEFLFSVMPEKSKTTVKSYLRNRQISIGSMMSTKFDFQLRVGDYVTLNKDQIENSFTHSMLRIVFEDDDIIVINKRNGLLSMATNKERSRTAYYILSEYLKSKDSSNRIFIVHRLDRETSGLMIFAKSMEVQHKLQQNWNELVLDRRYVAVVGGRPKNDSGAVTSYLAESSALTMYSTLDPSKGELATTHYKVLKQGYNNTLVELNLETGKKNQIRIHMKDMFCPIVGDKKYGGKSSFINRIALHARKIKFLHPVTGEEMNFETAIPSQFLKLLENQEQRYSSRNKYERN